MCLVIAENGECVCVFAKKESDIYAHFMQVVCARVCLKIGVIVSDFPRGESRNV